MKTGYVSVCRVKRSEGIYSILSENISKTMDQ